MTKGNIGGSGGSSAVGGSGATGGSGASGGAPGVQVLVSNRQYPFDITVDDTYVYWTEDSAVCRMPKDGGVVDMIPDQTRTHSIIAVNGVAYWTNQGSEGQGGGPPITDGEVMAGSFGGGTGSYNVIAAVQCSPRGITAADGYVYWANRCSYPATIVRRSIGTGGAQPTDEPVVNDPNAEPLDLLVHAGHVYWTDEYYKDVRIAPIDGSGGATSIPNLSDSVQYLDRAADYLYVTASATIYKVHLNGLTFESTMGGGYLDAVGVGAGDFFVYFAHDGGEVRRLSILEFHLGNTETVASDQTGVKRVALDDNYVYWTTHTASGWIARTPRGAGGSSP